MKKGHQGTSMGGLEYSKSRKKRMKAKAKRAEERWAAKSGEVVTRKIGDPKISPPPPPCSSA